MLQKWWYFNSSSSSTLIKKHSAFPFFLIDGFTVGTDSWSRRYSRVDDWLFTWSSCPMSSTFELVVFFLWQVPSVFEHLFIFRHNKLFHNRFSPNPALTPGSPTTLWNPGLLYFTIIFKNSSRSKAWVPVCSLQLPCLFLGFVRERGNACVDIYTHTCKHTNTHGCIHEHT